MGFYAGFCVLKRRNQLTEKKKEGKGEEERKIRGITEKENRKKARRGESRNEAKEE